MNVTRHDLLQLAATLPPCRGRKIVAALAARDAVNAEPESLEEFTKRAAAAFEKDMQPVCSAIVAALKDNDVEALKGLQALLAPLLREVGRTPSLSDLLSLQLGAEILAGMREVDEEISQHGRHS